MMRGRYILLAGAACILPSVASAQVNPPADTAPAASAEPAVADIVVTAQKRETNLQKTPIAISAVSGDALRTQQISSIGTLAQSLPSVNFGQSTGNARIAIRGVGFDNISLGNEGRVAYHVDGVYVARPAAALASFYDVERVEVLRGPQGTLYGRNATGGAVNVISVAPSDRFGGYIEGAYGNYDSKKAEGAIGGPLGAGFSTRLSFQVVDRDGYGRNLTNGLPVDDQKTRAVRGQIRFHPDSRIDARLSADYFSEKDHAYGFMYLGYGSLPYPATATTPALTGATPKGVRLGGSVPGDPRDSTGDVGPLNSREFWNVSLNVKMGLTDKIDLTSITGYRHTFYHTDTDLDGTSAPISVYDQFERSHSISQELRLSGTFGRTGEWMVGGYYFNEVYFGGIRIPLDPVVLGSNVPGSTLPPLTGLRQGNYTMGDQDTRALASFANVKLPIVDRLALRVGARYSTEKKALDEEKYLNLVTPYPPFVGFFPALPAGGLRAQQSHRWNSFTPSITLEFQATNRLFAYLTYSKGFKSGGFNLGNIQPPFAPEKLTDYEGGVRADWLNGRLRTNLSAFYYDYSNLQVSQVVGPSILIQNAAKARVYGMEAEVSTTPLPRLRLNANFSLLHSEYKDFSSVDPARAGLGVVDLSGNELTQAPKYTVNADASYTLPTSVGNFTLRGEARFVDRVYFSFYQLKTTSQPAYSLFNAFLSWKDDRGLSASVFVRNIANKRVLATALVGSGLVGFPYIGTFEPPRTYGVTLGWRF